MTAEQFCLRWNNHQSTLVSVFDGLLESGTLVDCTLAADGQYLKAHKVVLSACSPYLELLLSQHFDQHPIVILKDVKFEELKAMIEYMYRGEVNVTQEQLGRFLKAAETLKIKGLTNNEVGHSAGQVVTTAGITSTTVAAASNVGGAGDAREVVGRNRIENRKSLGSAQPRSPVMGNQTSLVETLKNAPASLVIDIPPISPVNSKDGSISPTPRKRRKRRQSGNDEISVEINKRRVNSDVRGSSFSERSSESVVDIDPLAMLETGLVKPEVKMESGERRNDDNDSDGEFTIDENYDGNAGPSNGSSGAADCGLWQGAISDEGENAESSKVLDNTDAPEASSSYSPFYSNYHRLSQDYLTIFGLKQEQEECAATEQFMIGGIHDDSGSDLEKSTHEVISSAVYNDEEHAKSVSNAHCNISDVCSIEEQAFHLMCKSALLESEDNNQGASCNTSDVDSCKENGFTKKLKRTKNTSSSSESVKKRSTEHQHTKEHKHYHLRNRSTVSKEKATKSQDEKSPVVDCKNRPAFSSSLRIVIPKINLDKDRSIPKPAECTTERCVPIILRTRKESTLKESNERSGTNQVYECVFKNLPENHVTNGCMSKKLNESPEKSQSNDNVSKSVNTNSVKQQTNGYTSKKQNENPAKKQTNKSKAGLKARLKTMPVIMDDGTIQMKHVVLIN